jgi:hypothetical protein
MVGLDYVDNTSDADKPISTEQQSALNLKADIDNPTFLSNIIVLGNANMGNDVNVSEGYVYRINGIHVLSNTNLGDTVVNSNINTVGNLLGLNVLGNVVISSNTVSTSNITGAFVVSGGIGVKANSYFGENVTIEQTCTVNIINALSDYRLKIDVVNISDQITVDNLRPVEYTNKLNNLRQYGFIAHEVAEHIPYITNGLKDEPEYQSLNYISLIPVLVKEIQNAKKEIAYLKTKII